MARRFESAIVTGMVIVPRDRSLEQTPSLINAYMANQVRCCRTPNVGGAVRAAENVVSSRRRSHRSRGSEIDVAGLHVANLILRRYRAANAVAEFSSVADLVHAGNRIAAADKSVEVVRRIALPGGVELRHRFTECEAGELDEGIVHAERAAGDLAAARSCRVVSIIRSRATGQHPPTSNSSPAVAARGPGEDAIEEGANDAVFGRGARVDVEVFTRTEGV